MATQGVPNLLEMDAAFALLEMQSCNPQTRTAYDAHQQKQTQFRGTMDDVTAAIILTQLVGTRIVIVEKEPEIKKVTCEIGTQTEGEIQSTNTPRKSYNRKAKTSFTMASVEASDDEEGTEYKPETGVKEEDMAVSDDDSIEDHGGRSKVLREINTNGNSSTDMVPIGDGNAVVPSRLLRQIDWASYTNATRKLLTAVFSRRVLATHSLTGKASPAFPEKAAKKKLDPSLVNDIIQTVVERCRVPENVVRTSITTKCADESKMLRSREKNKDRRVSKKENVPVTPLSRFKNSTFY